MYKAIKDSKIIAINETGDFPCLVYDEVIEDTDHNLQDYVMVDTEFVLTTDSKAIEHKKSQVRAVREQYFSEYVDFYQSKPLYWEELDEEFKQQVSDYRNYLKDYTKQENWWNENPLTFEEWLDKYEKKEYNEGLTL